MPLLILIPFMLLLFWQNRSQQKKQETAIAGLKKGDRVLTQTGLVGRLRSIDARYAELELPPSGTRVTVLRSGLLGRDGDGDAGAKDSTTEKNK
jgi:preprotein translocase subunit YajC